MGDSRCLTDQVASRAESARGPLPSHDLKEPVTMRHQVLLVLVGVMAMGATTASPQVGGPTGSNAGITRRVMVDERTVQVVRSTYAPKTVEPPGPHEFDVVIIPLSD